MSRRQIAEKVGDMFADWFRKDKEAQQEAVTRLGLPENNTATDRAKAMGFSDETYYHGSGSSFDEFDPSFTGAGGVGENFTWLTDNPKVASSYAEFVPTWKAKNKIKKEFNSQVYPLKIKQGSGQSYDMAGESYKSTTELGTLPTPEETFIQDFMRRKLGKGANDDYTVFNNLDDHMSYGADIKPSKHIAVNNQSIIRSPLAHFNPKYAGVGAGSILSADLMADEIDLEYKGLLDE